MLFELFGEVAFGRLSRSRKAQVVCRVFFGLLGMGLGLAGAYHFLARAPAPSLRLMHASIISMFLFIAALSLFNIACKRAWRWPTLGAAASFIVLLAASIFRAR
jgi:uncharacterized BrkB/YihY/UPF0761 family membrane protein